MTRTPKIDRLRWWQIADLLPIERELFGVEAWTEGMFWGELARGHYYRALTIEDGKLIGYAGLAFNPPDEAWVQNIAVRQDQQRNGYGRALLEDLLAEAARRGARKTALEVAAPNQSAQRLYAGYGFEPVAIRRGYYQPSNTDAVVMIREQ